MKKEYLISELAVKAGVTKRTIHYYVNKGLLPPPEGSGLNSRYTDEHFFRLLYIKKLKAEYFPLSKIKEILCDTDLKDIKASLFPADEPKFMRSFSEVSSNSEASQVEEDSIISMSQRRSFINIRNREDNGIISRRSKVRNKNEELVRIHFENEMELIFPKKIKNLNLTRRIIKMINGMLTDKEH